MHGIEICLTKASYSAYCQQHDFHVCESIICTETQLETELPTELHIGNEIIVYSLFVKSLTNMSVILSTFSTQLFFI